MTLSFASPHQPVTPLLVQLYDQHSLYRLAEDKSPAARQELCEIIAGILEMSSRPNEKELVADILISLIRQAETDLKRALSDRLSAMDNAPLRLILRLTEEEIDVAGPVLRLSKVLNDYDLLYIIQAHDSEYWRVIAERDNLSGLVSEKLAETRDAETVKVLAGNHGAELTRAAEAILADLACKNEDIARPLLHRPGLPVEIARMLYVHVAQDLRSFINTTYRLDGKGSAVTTDVDDVIAEFTAAPEDSDFLPTAAMLKAAELFAAKGQLTLPLMLSTLKRGQLQSFVAQYARFCELKPSLVVSMLQQSNGQGLALTARANDVSRDDFIAIFTLSRRMARPDAVTTQKDLLRAHAYYDRINKDLAIRLLRGCR